MRPEVFEILQSRMWRFHGICRLVADRLRMDASDAVEEVLGWALAEFVREERAGWFDEVPRTSLEAQVEYLFTLCALRGRRKEGRRPRTVLLELDGDTETVPGSGSGTDGAPPDGTIHRQTRLDTESSGQKGPGVEAPMDTLLADAQALAEVRKAALQIRAAKRRLVLLAIDFPDLVTAEHVESAVAARRRAFPRGAPGVWEGFKALRDQFGVHGASGKNWRLALVELFATAAPLGTTPVEALAEYENTVISSPLRHARADLVARFVGQRVEEDFHAP